MDAVHNVIPAYVRNPNSGMRQSVYATSQQLQTLHAAWSHFWILNGKGKSVIWIGNPGPKFVFYLMGKMEVKPVLCREQSKAKKVSELVYG